MLGATINSIFLLRYLTSRRSQTPSFACNVACFLYFLQSFHTQISPVDSAALDYYFMYTPVICRHPHDEKFTRYRSTIKLRSIGQASKKVPSEIWRYKVARNPIILCILPTSSAKYIGALFPWILLITTSLSTDALLSATSLCIANTPKSRIILWTFTFLCTLIT